MSGLELPGKATPAVHLVRHGQSTWNVEDRLQGQADDPQLTALGRDQAVSVAGLLPGIDAERLLTSDLQRAAQTAGIIGAAIGLAPIPTALLREQHYGALQGLLSAAAVSEWERLARSALDEYGDAIPESERRLGGGESRHDVQARVDALLASPYVTEARGDVVLVTHGDTIRVMLSSLLGDDPDDPVWRDVGNGEIHSIYRLADGTVNCVRTSASRSLGAVPVRRGTLPGPAS